MIEPKINRPPEFYNFMEELSLVSRVYNMYLHCYGYDVNCEVLNDNDDVYAYEVNWDKKRRIYVFYPKSHEWPKLPGGL